MGVAVQVSYHPWESSVAKLYLGKPVAVMATALVEGSEGALEYTIRLYVQVIASVHGKEIGVTGMAIRRSHPAGRFVYWAEDAALFDILPDYAPDFAPLLEWDGYVYGKAGNAPEMDAKCKEAIAPLFQFDVF